MKLTETNEKFEKGKNSHINQWNSIQVLNCKTVSCVTCLPSTRVIVKQYYYFVKFFFLLLDWLVKSLRFRSSNWRVLSLLNDRRFLSSYSCGYVCFTRNYSLSILIANRSYLARQVFGRCQIWGKGGPCILVMPFRLMKSATTDALWSRAWSSWKVAPGVMAVKAGRTSGRRISSL